MAGKLCPNCNELAFFKTTGDNRICSKCGFEMIIPPNSGKVGRGKKCANCGEELDINVEFCSKCGKEQPKIEKVEIKEEPQESVKEAEVVEVNNVEENSNSNNEEENNN